MHSQSDACKKDGVATEANVGRDVIIGDTRGSRKRRRSTTEEAYIDHAEQAVANKEIGKSEYREETAGITNMGRCIMASVMRVYGGNWDMPLLQAEKFMKIAVVKFRTKSIHRARLIGRESTTCVRSHADFADE